MAAESNVWRVVTVLGAVEVVDDAQLVVVGALALLAGVRVPAIDTASGCAPSVAVNGDMAVDADV